MHMNEQRRLHYLQAMGVDGYYPRWQLPGAAVSVLCDEIFEPELHSSKSIAVTNNAGENVSEIEAPTDAIGHSASEIESIEDIKSKSIPDVVHHIANDLTIDSKRRRDKGLLDKTVDSDQLNSAIDSTEKSAEAQEKISFNLGFWRVSDDLVVVDTRQPRLALPTEKLLHNIVYALGYSGIRLQQASQLRWPSMDDSFASDEGSARGMVEAFLVAENKKKAFSKIIVMGNHAAKFVLPNSEKVDHLNAFNFSALVGKTFDVSETGIQAKAIVVPSLTALLQKPNFKKITWQAIQAFRV